MTDKTIGIILTLKTTYGTTNDYKKELLKFLCNYSLLDYDLYTIELNDDERYSFLINNLIQAFTDFIEVADNPRNILDQFFSYKYNSMNNNNDMDAIISVFLNVQVIAVYNPKDIKNGSKYVNGFRDFKYKDLELSLDTKCFDNNKDDSNGY